MLRSFGRLKLGPLRRQLERRGLETAGATADKPELLRRLGAQLRRGLHAREVAALAPAVAAEMWKPAVAEDGDGDGMVSEAEFVDWHRFKAGRPPGDADLRRFRAADVDGDGEITAAEFEAYKAEHCRAVVGGQPTC